MKQIIAEVQEVSGDLNPKRYTSRQISVSRQKLQVMLTKVLGIFLIISYAAVAQANPRPLANAFSAMKQDNWDLAFDLASRDGEIARDIIEWHWHRAQKGTAEAALSFLNRRPDWPGLPYFRKRSEGSFLSASMKQTAQFFAKEAPQTAEGALAYARALEAGKQAKDANALITRAWESYEMDAELKDAYVTQYGSVIKSSSPERLREMLWQQNFGQVRALLPHLTSQDHALAMACLALYAGKDGVDPLISKLSKSMRSEPVLAHARFTWRMKTRNRSSAIEMMQSASKSAKSLGRPEVWAADRRTIARDLLFDKKYKTAYRLAANHHLSSGTDYSDLEWIAGYTALRHLNDPKTAQVHFERMLLAVDTPISLGRAYYWLAQAHKKQGRTAEAQKIFAQGAEHQTSFYGLLSAEEISAPFPYRFDPLPELPDWRSASFRKSSVFKAAILLFASGEDALGERFITHLAETLSDREIDQMTDFLEEYQRPHVLVMLGKRKASQGKNFPRPYFALHPLAQEGYSVPAQLSLSIARRESEFDPKVVSPVGAAGLMQVMPRTAREMAGKIGVRYDQNRMTRDWKYNARLGTAYLKELNERFGSNPVLVSVAYNAGPTRAENWSALLGDPRSKKINIVDWIEMIPFDETRNYVMRTAESIPMYRARLGKDPLPVPFSQFLQGAGF